MKIKKTFSITKESYDIMEQQAIIENRTYQIG